jgi:hypothetical protein
MSTNSTFTSFQDQRLGWEAIQPTPRRPSYLIDAQLLAELTWKTYDQVLTEETHSDTWEMRPTNHGRIERYRLLAEQAERLYSELYDQWMESFK